MIKKLAYAVRILLVSIHLLIIRAFVHSFIIYLTNKKMNRHFLVFRFLQIHIIKSSAQSAKYTCISTVLVNLYIYAF